MLEIWRLEKKKMNELGCLCICIFLAHVKFLFAASIAEATPDVNFLEILFSSTFGALFCYNVSYLVGRFIFFKNNPSKDRVFLKKRKKNFKKRNRIIIRIKNSKLGDAAIPDSYTHLTLPTKQDV